MGGFVYGGGYKRKFVYCAYTVLPTVLTSGDVLLSRVSSVRFIRFQSVGTFFYNSMT